MSRNLDLYLEDIIGAIRKIHSYTDDLDFERFTEDERTVDAVIRNLMVIGEAVFGLKGWNKTRPTPHEESNPRSSAHPD
ncbi:MAG: DUF86 domain-containing protein [Chamaesiphon sp.]|nr:DUF86 domain-containing protein [Chamaesiphon sp.]